MCFLTGSFFGPCAVSDSCSWRREFPEDALPGYQWSRAVSAWRAEVLVRRSAGLVPLVGSGENRSMPASYLPAASGVPQLVDGVRPESSYGLPFAHVCLSKFPFL